MGGKDAHQAAQVDLGGAQVLLTFRHGPSVCQSDNRATSGFPGVHAAPQLPVGPNLLRSISGGYDPIERITAGSLAAGRSTA